MTRALRFPSLNTGALPNQASGGITTHHLGPGTPQQVSIQGAFQANAFQNNAFLVSILVGARGGTGINRDFLESNLFMRVRDLEGARQSEVSVGAEAYATEMTSGVQVQTDVEIAPVGTAAEVRSDEQDTTDATRQDGGTGSDRKSGSTIQTRRRRL